MNLTIDSVLLDGLEAVLDEVGLNKRVFRQEGLRLAIEAGMPVAVAKLRKLSGAGGGRRPPSGR
jgi:hypothetical protein